MTLIHREVSLNGTVTDRPFNEDELKDLETIKEQTEAALREYEKTQKEKQVIADKIGLTLDELRTLLS